MNALTAFAILLFGVGFILIIFDKVFYECVYDRKIYRISRDLHEFMTNSVEKKYSSISDIH